MRIGWYIKNPLQKVLHLLCLLACMWAMEAEGQSRSFFFEIRSPAYKGLLLYKDGNYAASIPLLEQAVAGRHKNNPDLWEKLAHAYSLTGEPASGAEIYQNFLTKGAELNKSQALLYANSLMASGQLEEGRQVLVQYLHESGQEASAKELREMSLAELFRDSIRYHIMPVSINTEAAEFSPVVLSSGILFVSDRARAGLVKNRFLADESYGLDIFYGELSPEGEMKEVVRLNNLVNTEQYEGPAVVVNNGKSLYFTRSGPKGEMKLYQGSSILNQSSWGSIQLLNIPVKGSAGHPAVSNDGELIYFVSDMPGGYGGTDIYRIEKTVSGWSEPRNMGPLVNTAGNEMFPSLVGEDKLYFSSNGRMGLGGLDIFVASLVADSVLEVRNVGAPVNSPADDFGLSLHESGDWGYFSSNRSGGAGKDDIYRLNVHYVTLAGKLLDKTNRQYIPNATVSLYQQDVLLQQVQTDKKGSYSFKLFPGQEFELKFSAEEYRSNQEVVSTRQGQRSGIKKLETSLDRKVKMFVLGSIRKNDKSRAAGSTVYVLDQSSSRIDTVEADQRGNYEMELDVMSRYTFWTVCDGEASVSVFSTPEKGKASLSYYENMSLKPFTRYQVTGKITMPEGQKGPMVISRLNKLTLEADFLFTDEEGAFSFEAHSLARYELCLPNVNARPLILSSGWQKPVRNVEWSW